MKERTDPAVTGVEVFGFLYWITSAVAYVFYNLWALTPASVLGRHGITYYPSKYWAVAIPTWFCVTIIFMYWVYESLNMIYTSTKSASEQEGDYLHLMDKKFFSRDGDGLLPLVELPPAVVRMVLEEGMPPLEVEAKFKRQMAAQLAREKDKG